MEENPAPAWKEWFITLSVCFQHFATGVTEASPAVLIPAITKNGSDILATKAEASWITASNSMTSVLSFIIMPTLQHLYGRKITNVLVNIFLLVSAILMALSTSVTSLLIGRLIQGLSGSNMRLCVIVIGEYTHPRRRGSFTALKFTSFLIGILTCHSCMFILSWRQLNWLVAIPAVIGGVLTFFWPESPSWLAYKGRYEECRKSFTWMRGEGMEAKRELKELITVQRRLRKLNSQEYSFKEIIKAFKKKEFLKPLLISMVLAILIQSSGHHYLLAFVVRVMEKLTEDELKTYYFTISFDLIKVIAGVSSSVFIRMIKRRTLLIYSGGLISLFLGLACLCSFLESRKIISPSWLTPSLLVAYNFFNSIGIVPVIIVLFGEIFPLKYRGLGMSVNGVVWAIYGSVLFKFTWAMLDELDIHGTFIIYLVIMVCCLICLHFILPETKDRTLQNIELEFMNVDIKLEDEDFHDSSEKPLNALAHDSIVTRTCN